MGRPLTVEQAPPAPAFPPPRVSLVPAPPAGDGAPPSSRSGPASRRPKASIHPLTASSPPRSAGSFQLIQTARDAELEAALGQLRGEVARLAAALATVRAHVVEESEPEVVGLVLNVAERVVGRELALDPELLVSWVEEGLAALPRKEEITVAVAPDVAARIERERESLGSPRVVVDPALAVGTCELREGATTIEVGAAARMAAISDALGVDGR
jgi:hypothetical protein